ncbi:TetR/AcrR family transcriptional regulator [Catenulispora sp. NF23]|uniref:TetR/AcrR family transcriptional regulator n=1 Tax=Catenulispora pinistramenti TaxID=2705254 RepID=A0ABS5L4T7_9ACTN|nr:TetR/AcrR family transcriptional regulator [Catenulispora pinistramenti]MBS2540007.1 TetR/AcrR family transcriptional regulator [Catenulispora pinistramenti]MBS2553311.1 TetR/AcrR family transcriptional regulator [Catenulispora pinistramenti]
MPVEPTEPRRRRVDAERNRRRILTGAREVFRDHGVAATLNDIAHHVGIGVGTVYRHFSDKEELIDALFDDMVETVDGYLREALEEPDAWLGLTRALERTCEVQAFDRGLREVMLGTGRGPQRQRQMRDRVAPSVDALVARAQEQGTLRADVVPPDFAVVQLMLGAVSDHTGQPELWRRYLVLLVDGLRARPENVQMPELQASDDAMQEALAASSARSVRDSKSGR